MLPADEPAPLFAATGDSPYHTPGDRLLPRWDTSYAPERTLHSWPAGPQLARGTVRHDSSGQAAVRLEELPAGAYRLTYRTADEYGAVYETSREFIMAGAGSSLALPLVLLPERGSVAVGDTARLLVHSGLLEQPVFLDVFR